MDTVLLLTRTLLFGIFVLAGSAKVFDPAGSRKALREFGVPGILVPPAAVILPLAEVAIGILFLFPETSWFAAAAGGGLVLIFTAGIGWQMAAGRAPDCHCFGQLHSEPAGVKSLLRNSAIAALAFALLFSGPAAQGPELASTSQGMAQALLLLFMALGVVAIAAGLRSLLKQQAAISKRLDLLELAAAGDQPLNREGTTRPDDGLPIGAPLPPFTLPDVSGRIIGSGELVSNGRPVLLFFVSPGCTPCGELLPEIDEWQREFAERVDFVFVSSGDSKENLKKFGSVEGRTIVLQKHKEYSEILNAVWTPTALLVDANGRIASHPAAGDNAIRWLIERLRKEDLDKEFLYFASGSEYRRPPKIGQRVPDLGLPGHGGFGSNDLPTLALFWSKDCPHCKGMADDLANWTKQRGPGGPNLLIFADGKESDYKPLGIDSPMILEDDFATAEKFGMHGTPSAVLIDASGVIVSEAAVGADNIWALIGRYPRTANGHSPELLNNK
jgi:thiol-disulfide isomerase/thioredoxin/uncharacterized membrane protein YphA (DoxX/SURF4 family)